MEYLSLTKDRERYSSSILRDTAAKQSLLLSNVLPLSEDTYLNCDLLVNGVGGTVRCPLHKCYLESNIIQDEVTVAVTDKLPVEGITLLLSNDIEGDKVHGPIIIIEPINTSIPPSKLYPACAVTRSQYKAKQSEDQESLDISSLFQLEESPSSNIKAPESKLIAQQKADPSLQPLFQASISEEEAKEHSRCYYISNNLLMRK